MDTDGDGKISKEEWLAFFSNMFDDILSNSVDSRLVAKRPSDIGQQEEIEEE